MDAEERKGLMDTIDRIADPSVYHYMRNKFGITAMQNQIDENSRNIEKILDILNGFNPGGGSGGSGGGSGGK